MAKFQPMARGVSFAVFAASITSGAGAAQGPNGPVRVATGESQSGLRADAQVALEALPASRVPLDVHRRAARYFEAIAAHSDSNWFSAHLADYATPMLRPGVSGTAYWEIPVRGALGEPLGYILLATGEHDFPVVGAARGGEPPSAELARLAALRGERVARIWSPALFSYVAENARGEEVARLGTLPSRIEGVDKAVLDLPESARRGFSAVAPGQDPVHELPSGLGDLRLTSFGSWEEYKATMADGDRLEQAIVERNSAPFWKMERSVSVTAQELVPEAAERVALLPRGTARYELSGPGKEHVTLEREEGPAGESWLRVRALSAPEGGVATAKLKIQYGSGEVEQLGFVIAPRLAAPKKKKHSARKPVTALPSSCKTVAIRTSVKGKYLRAHERKGPIDARADKVGVWETFDLVQHSGGRISLRSGPANRYVSAIDGGGKHLALYGTRASTWESFKLESQPGGTYALKAHNGRYVSAKNGGGDTIVANRTRASTWERFHIACNPPAPRVYFADLASEPTAWANQRKYKQLKGRTGPNRSPCASGCGATSWAMQLGYIDYMATKSSKYRPFKRIYLSGGGRGRFAVDTVAPEFNNRGIEKATLEIRGLMNDWGASGCSPTGSRFTLPQIMAQATQYFWGRVPAYARADYDGAFISTSAGVNKVIHSLRTRRKPITVGMHEHYPVAFGIRSVTPRRWDPSRKRWVTAGSAKWMVDANWGWGEKFSRSVPLFSWLQGTVETSSYSRVKQIAKNCKLRNKSGRSTGRVDRDYNCRTHLKSSERHVGMEVAADLIMRDVVPGLRSKSQKACLLKSTDIQCAPCNTTDRLIVRMDIRSKRSPCPSGTVNELR